jgi:hypothetical protein
MCRIRPFQENKPPKYKLSSEEKASGLEGFKFWNYLRPFGLLRCNALSMKFTGQVSLNYPGETLYDEFLGSEVRCTWLLKRLNDYQD